MVFSWLWLIGADDDDELSKSRSLPSISRKIQALSLGNVQESAGENPEICKQRLKTKTENYEKLKSRSKGEAQIHKKAVQKDARTVS